MDPEAFQLREEPVIDAGPAVLMLRDRSRRTGAWCSGRCVVAARKPAWDWNMWNWTKLNTSLGVTRCVCRQTASAS